MGSRLTHNGMDKVYIAASRWVHHALQSDGSLFTPGVEIWSRELLAELRRRLQNNPDKRRVIFMDILRLQLKGSPPEIYQLMAEALYIHYLWCTNVKSVTKVDNISRPLSWSARPIEIPAYLIETLTCDIANFLAGHASPSYAAFLIEFAKQWKEQAHSDRDEMLKDPWAFKNFATGLEFQSALLKGKDKNPNMQREALLHLIHPDAFEAIVDIAVKEKIAAAFPDAVKDPTDDIDYKLQQIRANLEKQIDAHDHLFGKPVIRSHWDYCIKRVSNCL